MKIIRASEKHVQDIVKLWIKLNDYHAGIDPVHKIKKDAGTGFEQYVRSKLLSDEDLFLVAVIEGKGVGFSISAVNEGRPDVFEKPPVVEISDMLVLEEHRWRGIGSKMLTHIREWAIEKGIKRIELNAEVRNNIGLSFWKKHGFNDYLHRLYVDL